jgi:hypothetical protein
MPGRAFPPSSTSRPRIRHYGPVVDGVSTVGVAGAISRCGDDDASVVESAASVGLASRAGSVLESADAEVGEVRGGSVRVPIDFDARSQIEPARTASTTTTKTIFMVASNRVNTVHPKRSQEKRRRRR